MTVEEMQDALTRLNIEHYTVRGYEIQAECPAHEERTGHKDKHPSFYINADTGMFICFSCGWKGGFSTLLNYVSGTTNAKEWLASSQGLNARFQRAIKEDVKIEEQTYITESMLGAFVSPPEEALRSRGLSLASAQKYGVLWDARKSNWIIPIREPLTNKLLGWQEKGHVNRSFRNYPTGVKKSISLFGYDPNRLDEFIVVESPLDVLRLDTLGFAGGVATYGSMVSDVQFNIIRGSYRIVFAMDNDEAGLKSSMDLLTKCQEAGTEAWFFNYGTIDVKDIGGMSLDEVRYGLQNAKHIARGKKALHGWN